MDATKSNLPKKENYELAEDLLARFPGVDRAELLKDMTALCFFWMRWGNKREERAACDLLNELQRIAIRNTEVVKESMMDQEAMMMCKDPLWRQKLLPPEPAASDTLHPPSGVRRARVHRLDNGGKTLPQQRQFALPYDDLQAIHKLVGLVCGWHMNLPTPMIIQAQEVGRRMLALTQVKP